MENLTYEIYLTNPAVREQFEREVRRARAEAVCQIIAQIMEMFSRMFTREGPKPAAPAADVRLKTA